MTTPTPASSFNEIADYLNSSSMPFSTNVFFELNEKRYRLYKMELLCDGFSWISWSMNKERPNPKAGQPNKKGVHPRKPEFIAISLNKKEVEYLKSIFNEQPDIQHNASSFSAGSHRNYF